MSVMTAGTPDRLAVGPARREAPKPPQRPRLRVVREAPTPLASGVRLTRRGRAVVKILATMAILLVVALAGLAGAAKVQAAGSGAPAGSVYRHLTAVVVRPGESLWSLAMQAQPHADPRVVVQEIIDVNALHGSTVWAGERLWVPKG